MKLRGLIQSFSTLFLIRSKMVQGVGISEILAVAGRTRFALPQLLAFAVKSRWYRQAKYTSCSFITIRFGLERIRFWIADKTIVFFRTLINRLRITALYTPSSGIYCKLRRHAWLLTEPVHPKHFLIEVG